MTKEEWLQRELAKAPVRDEAHRRYVMKLWGLKPAKREAPLPAS
ncbi:hypothetical protein [Streptomyces sp. NPDC000229]